ncbi:unnamed protein product [Ceratitis capitata]|uniref:(Mediterranean fruit fly) hypothetical protein n=1 Tax=Ceratitis capitata TaxID=7213 RepID=A0A811V446_CERCA|nr:unnamed protein product [Ceratitis capitata]
MYGNTKESLPKQMRFFNFFRLISCILYFKTKNFGTTPSCMECCNHSGISIYILVFLHHLWALSVRSGSRLRVKDD